MKVHYRKTCSLSSRWVAKISLKKLLFTYLYLSQSTVPTSEEPLIVDLTNTDPPCQYPLTPDQTPPFIFIYIHLFISQLLSRLLAYRIQTRRICAFPDNDWSPCRCRLLCFAACHFKYFPVWWYRPHHCGCLWPGDRRGWEDLCDNESRWSYLRVCRWCWGNSGKESIYVETWDHPRSFRHDIIFCGPRDQGKGHFVSSIWPLLWLLLLIQLHVHMHA